MADRDVKNALNASRARIAMRRLADANVIRGPWHARRRWLIDREVIGAAVIGGVFGYLAGILGGVPW